MSTHFIPRLFRTFTRQNLPVLALATLGAVAVTGCGIGASDPSVSPLVISGFTGKAMGGQAPIIGATVKAYATTSGGYGVGALLQEAKSVGTGGDTDAGGRFSFAGGYTCPAGQFVYLVSSGGNTGANAVNPGAVLVAALGRCEDLFANTSGGNYTGPTIYVNELTTVAAAYALGNFSSVSGTGATTSVLIGASATNNAAQVSGVSTGCVAGVGSCTTTQTAGLAHAFQNANDLVNPFANTSITGANAKLPGNAGAVVPQELIDTIGNILVSCVNSAGGVAGDGTTTCGTLFAATTIGSNVPTNTFSAMVNLAANPTLGGSVTAVANLYVLAGTLPVYSPTLSSAPVNDYSIGINYPTGLGASTAAAHLATCATDPCQGISYPTSGAVDINDVYYATNGNSLTVGSGPINIFSFASNGNLLSNTSTATTTFKNGYDLSVDALGNGYIVNGSGSGSTALGEFTASGGVVAGPPTAVSVGGVKVYATAVDRANNVWVLGAGTSGSTLFKGPAAPASASLTGQAAISVTVPSSPGFIGLSIDPNQNVWTTNSTTLAILQNTGTLGTPTYSSSSLLTASPAPSGSPVVGITFAGSPYIAYVSSYTGVAGVQPFTPTLTGPEVTGLTAGTLTNASGKITGSVFNEADGAGNIWLADTNSHSVIEFNPAAGTGPRYIPCLGGSPTCASIFGASGKPFEVSLDSTGSIWVADPAGGNIVQIIGAAAPTWPLLSLGKTGKP